METLDLRSVRRLALARAGLLGPRRTGLPARAGRGAAAARRTAAAVIDRFGYLQLDTISVAGARSHGIVLLSRLEGFDGALAETLLRPGAPLFEYWGHEASWIPLDLYPAFEFRRRAFRKHPWWGDVLGRRPGLVREILARVRAEGPIRSGDVEDPRGEGRGSWWDHGDGRRVLAALWSSGELAIRERRGFQRTWDLAERVIPAALREHPLPEEEAIPRLLLRALEGHGWADARTLSRTFRTRGPARVAAALGRLREEGSAVPCDLVLRGGARKKGWIRPADLEAAARLRAARLPGDRGVLLSPFDPLLWDRERVRLLFGFEQVLEIYVPAARRRFGYYCLPVLAGERLVARVDLKARRAEGRLEVVSARREEGPGARPAEDRCAAEAAIRRFARGVGLEPGRIRVP